MGAMRRPTSISRRLFKPVVLIETMSAIPTSLILPAGLVKVPISALGRPTARTSLRRRGPVTLAGLKVPVCVAPNGVGPSSILDTFGLLFRADVLLAFGVL